MKRRLTESGEGNPNPSSKLIKISTEKRRDTVPEAILVEVLARLPLKTLARFKSVCKTWRSEIESAYFRSRFFSLHRNYSSSPSSSSSWALIFTTEFNHPITEAIGFYGRDTWNLPRSLASYILPFQRYLNLPPCHYYYVASSNGLVWIEVVVNRNKKKSFVGNPITQQWVEIPPPPDQCDPTGLVTRLDENGVVSSFKVVRTCDKREPKDRGMYVWRVYVYSSETGLWSYKRLLSSCRVTNSDPSVNLDGMLYMSESNSRNEFGVVVAYDFYQESGDQCKVIPLPYPDNRYVKRCLTTSCGDVMYVEILYRRLKVWRLSKDKDSKVLWQLSREEINMANVGFDVHCSPMGMNPFDADILYLWSRQHDCLVTGNLGTQEFVVNEEWSNSDTEGCRVNNFDSKVYMDNFRNDDSTLVVILSQFVLRPWMDSVPRPPLVR